VWDLRDTHAPAFHDIVHPHAAVGALVETGGLSFAPRASEHRLPSRRSSRACFWWIGQCAASARLHCRIRRPRCTDRSVVGSQYGVTFWLEGHRSAIVSAVVVPLGVRSIVASGAVNGWVLVHDLAHAQGEIDSLYALGANKAAVRSVC